MRSKTFIAIPPGETIKEQLIDKGMNLKDFSIRMDMSEEAINSLINGEMPLTKSIALKLENVLGVPNQFWTNLENIYRVKLCKIDAENNC